MWAASRATLLRRGRHVAAGMATAGAVAGATAAAAAAAPPTGRAQRTLWEQLMHAPPFSADGSRYDQSTYAGRAVHFIDLFGDVTTLTTSDAELREHMALLKRHAEGHVDGPDADARLWRASKVVNACVRPDSGETIPAPFRFTAFAPANLIICTGLLRPGAGLASAACWQWANQSYNAAVNWHNRSTSAPPRPGAGGGASGGPFGITPEQRELLSAYITATASALAIGVGMGALGRRFDRGGGLVRLTVPMLAVAVSSVVNLVLTRQTELNGIPISTEDGIVLGESAAVGRRALLQCAASRALWSFLCLTFSPLLTRAALGALPAALRTGAPAAAVEASAMFACIWACVPMSIALFPQRDAIGVDGLEPELRELRHPRTGKPVTAVWYNRGL